NQVLLLKISGGNGTAYSITAQALTADLGTRVYDVENRNLPVGGQHVFAITAAVDGSVHVQLAGQATDGSMMVRLLGADRVTVLANAVALGPNGTADVSAPVRQGQTVLAQVLAPDDEQQTITIPSGVTQLTFSCNGIAGTPLTFSSNTTAAQLEANLSTI